MTWETQAGSSSGPGDRARRAGRRRVNGEGTIRQRADGRWEGRAYVLTTDGREIRRSVYGKTWEEAHEALTRLQADALSGVRIPATGWTVGEYLTYWLREIVQDRVRPTTYRSHEWLVRVHLVPALGKRKLATLQAADIRRAINKLKAVCQCCALGKDREREEKAERERARRAGRPPRKNAREIAGARCCAKTPAECCQMVLSDGSIRHLHRVLRSALQDAVGEGMLSQNVARNLRLSHRYRPRFTPWTGDEARAFLRAVSGDRLYALYAVALSLGLRRGEALGLSWSDVDLNRGVIRVRQALYRADGKLQFGPVKSDGSERAIAMPDPCRAALEQHREQQAGERSAAGKAWTDRGLVFTTKIGTPIEPRNINRHFAKLCDRAGVRRIRFHDLRHSCATLLYEQGVPIENIQDVLGHSSPTITKMIYVEVTEKVQRAAVDRLDYLFGDGER
ncbi:MAG: tyrosine-type recombinase/integrase [Actinopolymorphaceae bacterium]